MTTTNSRELQVGSSRPTQASALALVAALQEAGIPSAVHQFPEFQGNWWAVCVARKGHLKMAETLVRMFDAGERSARAER